MQVLPSAVPRPRYVLFVVPGDPGQPQVPHAVGQRVRAPAGRQRHRRNQLSTAARPSNLLSSQFSEVPTQQVQRLAQGLAGPLVIGLRPQQRHRTLARDLSIERQQQEQRIPQRLTRPPRLWDAVQLHGEAAQRAQANRHDGHAPAQSEYSDLKPPGATVRRPTRAVGKPKFVGAASRTLRPPPVVGLPLQERESIRAKRGERGSAARRTTAQPASAARVIGWLSRYSPKRCGKHDRGTVPRTTLDGIPITTPARTLLDLATCVDDDGVEQALANAIRRGLTTDCTLCPARCAARTALFRSQLARPRLGRQVRPR
jgi:hypothetical protein